MSHFISCYAECRYAECHMLSVVMLNVVMLSVVAPKYYGHNLRSLSDASNCDTARSIIANYRVIIYKRNHVYSIGHWLQCYGNKFCNYILKFTELRQSAQRHSV